MLSHRVIEEADTDKDGLVSFSEFENVTTNLDVNGKMSFISFQ